MIFVSTSYFKERRSVKHVLNECLKVAIKNIELGAAHQHEEGIVDFLKKYKKEHGAEFTIHAYFPPEKKPVIVNLASQDPEILKESMSSVKKSIDVAKEIKARLYSFHAGFRVDPESLGKPFKRKNIASYEDAYNTFVDSIDEICFYAKNRDVKIAMEPNVVSKYNLINGKNELLLMCELHEIKRLLEDLTHENLGILLDLGHLKITANNLKFDQEEFMMGVKDRVLGLHVHDNDGVTDLHMPFKADSWVLEVLNRNFLKNSIPITLEIADMDIKDIRSQIRLLTQFGNKGGGMQ